MAGIWRFVPLILLGTCALWIVGRVRHNREAYGRSPIRLFRSGSAVQTFTEIRAVGLGVLLVWQAAAAAFDVFVPLGGMLFRPWPVAGTVVFLAGVSVTAKAISDMGASWQMGFDQNVPRAALVRDGLFRFSRNPIYGGMVVALIGWMLFIPTLLSALIVVGAALGARFQVLREERYLTRAYGAEFRTWARDVGRFVPWLGRLR